MHIVIEGADCCGKSHLINAVNKECKGDLITTREPGSHKDPICTLLRTVILDRRTWEEISTLLFMADRMQHDRKVITKALREGYNVLQDRGLLSTLVLQEVYLYPEKERIVRSCHLDNIPDLCIVLDVSQEVLKQRRAKRQFGTDVFEDKHVAYDLSYAKLVENIKSTSDKRYVFSHLFCGLHNIAKEMMVLPYNTPAESTLAVVTVRHMLETGCTIL